MKELFKLVVLSAFVFITACATMPASTPENLWGTPNRSIGISSEQQNAELIASMQPCIEHARHSFADVSRRYKAGLLQGAAFMVIFFSDQKATTYIEVQKIENGFIHGLVDTRDITFQGKYYPRGGRIVLGVADIADWYVLYPDRPPEGNLLGRFLLLKMDGLAPLGCNPTDAEFQHYRYFSTYYSFVPPGTDGWVMRGASDEADMIMQEGDVDIDVLNTLSSSRYRVAASVSDQELIEMVRSLGRYGDEEGVRYNVLELEADIYSKTSARCASLQHVVEDKQALLSKSGKRGLMIRDVQSLVCIHPYYKEGAIVLTYSHRHHRGKRDPEFTNKAERVFNSLAFTRPNI